MGQQGLAVQAAGGEGKSAPADSHWPEGNGLVLDAEPPDLADLRAVTNALAGQEAARNHRSAWNYLLVGMPPVALGYLESDHSTQRLEYLGAPCQLARQVKELWRAPRNPADETAHLLCVLKGTKNSRQQRRFV
jgi:hypothetical protein